jgi:paraquat-inducible protein B
MSKHANPAVIGGFVLGAVVLVIVAILVFTTGALFRDRIEMITYFPGSVQGLNVGAQVQFQGVPIGQVTGIGLDYLPERDSFRIPVRYDIWPRSVTVLGGVSRMNARQVLQRMVDEKGLRARLESVSFVTGQYLIALSLNPDLPSRGYEVRPGEPIRVPALPAIRDRVEEILTNLQLGDLVSAATDTLQAIHDLVGSGALGGAVQELNAGLVEAKNLLSAINTRLEPIAAQAEQTLADYGSLAGSMEQALESLADRLEAAAGDVSGLAKQLQAQVDPVAQAAVGALQDTRGAMRAVETLTREASDTRRELDRLLAEANRTARSVRALADYLERHPEALLQGKR